MRLALLSALADPAASAGERPAFRRFAGKSVLAHQIDCAAHLGCERILCLAPGHGPDLATAKAHAERNGVRFEAVDTLLRLATQVTANDEVIHIADGVLPDRGELVAALANRPAVLAFPEEPALAKGFERLDGTRAWSGALRTRGDAVARLADMPPDCDLGSTLLRIALQGGTRIVELGEGMVEDDAWQRRVDRQVAAVTEWRWITRQVRPAPFSAPGLALTERVGLRWARDLGGDRWSRAPHGAAALGLIGAAGAWFGDRPVVGLAILALAVAALAVASVFDRVEATGSRLARPPVLLAGARGLGDGIFVALLSSLIMVVPAWLGVLMPAILVAVLRLGQYSAAPRWRALFSDRTLLLAAMVPGAYLGWSTILVAATTLVGLSVLLWASWPHRTELTAD